ncbi:MAG: hypothetical protein NTW08_06845 [Gammaproteobacteria bacterium]|nr:hypothetical protein [Gammaproteobacteria bacterium]
MFFDKNDDKTLEFLTVCINGIQENIADIESQLDDYRAVEEQMANPRGRSFVSPELLQMSLNAPVVVPKLNLSLKNQNIRLQALLKIQKDEGITQEEAALLIMVSAIEKHVGFKAVVERAIISVAAAARVA